jgi:hypothetical protein
MRHCVGFQTTIFFCIALLYAHIPADHAQERSKIPTVIDMSSSELVRAYPELKTLSVAQSQDELPQLLEKVGDRVQLLFEDFPNTSSLEQVHLEELDDRGDTVRSTNRKYQYLIIAHPQKDAIRLEEYRTDLKGSEINPDNVSGFILTAGDAASPLFFHPLFGSECSFRYLGTDVTRGGVHVIAFAQRPETARLKNTLTSRAGPVRFYLQGIAWVDPASYQIVRIRTDLLEPLIEAGLAVNTTQVELGEFPIAQSNRTLWLPRDAVITMKYMGRLYRNRHRYTDYRLFTVDSQEGQKQIVLPKPPIARGPGSKTLVRIG